MGDGTSIVGQIDGGVLGRALGYETQQQNDSLEKRESESRKKRLT